MIVPPAYFESVRREAAALWDQLEANPVLAGPWHQLFKQVQSPRHVLSELLQNADDAGATEARVRIENHVFMFEHNGEDFKQEHLASLCRFGYSNKRALHTIGFRGIGFKSTFSLGDRVELHTPTLAVGFDRQRFSEPRWSSVQLDTHGKTLIRVPVRDEHRLKEVERNLAEWAGSPVPLLFFRNIRRLQIGDVVLRWTKLGPGPIENSEWMSHDGQEGDPFLLVRSPEEAFPPDSSHEIRQERMVSVAEESDLPPSTVEIVLGANGRLFVVLPTGVETKLPFACNGPFIQDPARLKIKDPETSPTNRWLLERVGRLVASTMINWLALPDLPPRECVRAYRLFPGVDVEGGALERSCGTTVREIFVGAINNKPLLLTDGGALTLANASVIIPDEVLEVWPAEQAATLLDDKNRPALCRHVKAADRRKLLQWRVVEEIDKRKLIDVLRHKRLPSPGTWARLMHLWAYLAPDITSYQHAVDASELKIVPVQGKDVLYAAAEVTRLGEKRLLASERDWEFLSAYLLVLNPNWPRYLAEQRREAGEGHDASESTAVRAAYAVLEKTGLNQTSDVDEVIAKVASSFFSVQGHPLADCVRLTQIAAKLGATVDRNFRLAVRNGNLCRADDSIFFDNRGTLEELVPPNLRGARLLHADYIARFESCSREEWVSWVASGRSGLQSFIPLVKSPKLFYSHRQASQEARNRNCSENLANHYASQQFVLDDWDFPHTYWEHWQQLANKDDRIWTRVVDNILSQQNSYWTRAKSARMEQVASKGGSRRSVIDAPLLPGWALRLRELPCLRDTRGFCRRPGELLRRTPETESLLDVEFFVEGRSDTEGACPVCS